jgi:putative NIF3 family GTP cyclohydrolase 1 type 2
MQVRSEDSGFGIQDSGIADQSGRETTLAVSPSSSHEEHSPRLSELVELIKSRLKVSTLQVVGELDAHVSRVGICCGSGGELLSAAISAGCDVFFTGEATFHKSLEARTAGIALVLAGHYATERPAMEHLAALLAREFPKISASPSQSERDPIQWR